MCPYGLGMLTPAYRDYYFLLLFSVRNTHTPPTYISDMSIQNASSSISTVDDKSIMSIPAMKIQGEIVSIYIKNYRKYSTIFARDYSENEEKINDDITNYIGKVEFISPNKSRRYSKLTDEERAEKKRLSAEKKAAAALKKAEKQAAREAKQRPQLRRHNQPLKRLRRRLWKKSTPRMRKSCSSNLSRGHDKYSREDPRGCDGRFLRYWKNKQTGELTEEA